MALKNAVDQPLLNKEHQEFEVPIRPDKSVSPAKFLPDPFIPGGYKAHPTTIRAMRKDLFVAGLEGFEDVEQLYTCQSCHNELDLQFWVFCPFCEQSFPKNVK